MYPSHLYLGWTQFVTGLFGQGAPHAAGVAHKSNIYIQKQTTESFSSELLKASSQSSEIQSPNRKY